LDRLRSAVLRARESATPEHLVVGACLVFALFVQSGFFAYSTWMLGDMAYHRGVAYTMQAGMLQGEGPFRGLLTYYGGLFPLFVGFAADFLGTTFDAVVSVISWSGGIWWVLAVWILGRHLWPSSRSTVAVFVALATFAAPFSSFAGASSEPVVWTESVLAGSHAYWPIFPRDIALILLVVTAAVLLLEQSRRRIVIVGVLIGLMMSLHVQIAILAGWLVTTYTLWLAYREKAPTRLADIPAIGAVSLLVSAWWWLPRVGPTIEGGLWIADNPLRLALRLDPISYVIDLGMVGVLSVIGFLLLMSSRQRGRSADFLLVWAVSLLAILPLDRMIEAFSFLSERRLWLVFSIPATAAAAVGGMALLRIFWARRSVAVAVVLAAIISSLPGIQATLQTLHGVYVPGRAGQVSYDEALWQPVWADLNNLNREQHGIVVGTYDTNAIWSWSFSGAQVVSAFMPGYVKVGFDLDLLTGLGYEGRLRLQKSAFMGRDAMCRLLPSAGVSAFLLERSGGFVATYDQTTAMDYRVDPRDRNAANIERQVRADVVYYDRSDHDYLLIRKDGRYRTNWIDRDIRRVVIQARFGKVTAPTMRVIAGGRNVEFNGSESADDLYVLDVPAGLANGVRVIALRPLRLYRVTAYEEIPGTAGPDGPFTIDVPSFCG
jgi:hypothetical protein